MRTQKQDEAVEAFKTWYMWHNPRTQFAPNGYLCLSLGAEKKLRVDKAPRACISNVIWILSSDTICQLNQLLSNSEAAMLT